MKSSLKIAAFFFSTFVALDCENPSGGDGLPPVLYGVVREADGTPIEGAGVHYVFNLAPASLAKAGEITPSTQIQYSIPRRSFVRVQIFRRITEELILTLVEDTVNPGTYVQTFSTSDMTNGLYVYRVMIDSVTVERTMYNLHLDLAALTASSPLTRTGADGSFQIQNEVLGIGYLFAVTSMDPGTPDTVSISPEIMVVVHKEGYETHTKSITVDPGRAKHEAFELQKTD